MYDINFMLYNTKKIFQSILQVLFFNHILSTDMKHITYYFINQYTIFITSNL